MAQRSRKEHIKSSLRNGRLNHGTADSGSTRYRASAGWILSRDAHEGSLAHWEPLNHAKAMNCARKTKAEGGPTPPNSWRSEDCSRRTAIPALPPNAPADCRLPLGARLPMRFPSRPPLSLVQSGCETSVKQSGRLRWRHSGT